MNDLQERALRSSLIPKRPSQQPGRPLAHPKRLLLQPSVPPPISLGITEQPWRPLTHPNHASIPYDEVGNRIPLSEMATVKCEALRPQESLERKKAASSYPAVVSRRRSGKPSFLARATSLFLK
jgi:hypothetical protein